MLWGDVVKHDTIQQAPQKWDLSCPACSTRNNFFHVADKDERRVPTIEKQRE